LLADVAKNAGDSHIRRIAIKKLIDQDLLAEIAQKDSDSHIRQTAVWNLTDPYLLAKIAQKDSDLEVCRDAVEKIADQELLAEIVKGNRYLNVKIAAIRKFDKEHKRSIPEIVEDVWQNKESYKPESMRDFIHFMYKISQQEQKEILRKYDGKILNSEREDYADMPAISIHFPHE
jgi:hypothetical protein